MCTLRASSFEETWLDQYQFCQRSRFTTSNFSWFLAKAASDWAPVCVTAQMPNPSAMTEIKRMAPMIVLRNSMNGFIAVSPKTKVKADPLPLV